MVRTIATVALVALFVLVELVSAAPRMGGPPFSIAKSLSKRSFRVERVQHRKPTPRSAHKAMRKAFNKFGWTMPAALTQKAGTGAGANGTAAASNQTGSVVNNPEDNDVEFLSPITVGGQTMMMDFDTGSSDLWLFSTALPTQAQQGHTNFDPAQSSTFKQQQGSSFKISFGDGSAAEGNIVGTDTVDIGGATATGQTVELATAVSQSFIEDTQSNGLVGLAFSKINTVLPQPATTFLDTIQKDLALPVMTASLKSGTAGAYEFGKINNASFTGNLNSVPVDDSQGFWQIESSSFAIGNGAVQQNTAGSPAIADTGTTLLLVDDNVAQAYYSQVKNAAVDENQGGMFTFPCDSQLQDLKIALGPQHMATIDKSLLNFQKVAGEPNTCVGAMQGNQGSGLQIYGDVLFKSQFTVFNIADKTIAFAPHA